MICETVNRMWTPHTVDKLEKNPWKHPSRQYHTICCNSLPIHSNFLEPISWVKKCDCLNTVHIFLTRSCVNLNSCYRLPQCKCLVINLQMLPITGIRDMIFPVILARSLAIRKGIFVEHISINWDTLQNRLSGISSKLSFRFHNKPSHSRICTGSKIHLSKLRTNPA